MPRLLVIGGMAAGMSAASKLKRLRPEWEAAVLEAGPDLSYGACGLPYWISGEVRGMEDLYALAPEEIAARGIEVRLRQRAHGDQRHSIQRAAVHHQHHQQHNTVYRARLAGANFDPMHAEQVGSPHQQGKCSQDHGPV